MTQIGNFVPKMPFLTEISKRSVKKGIPGVYNITYVYPQVPFLNAQILLLDVQNFGTNFPEFLLNFLESAKSVE